MTPDNKFYSAGQNPPDGSPLTLFALPLSRTHSLEHAFALTCKFLTSDLSRPRLITFANPLGVRIANGDARYQADLLRMDLVFCDGIALVFAVRWLCGFPMQRISFDSTSLAPRVFEHIRAHGMSVAFVGGRAGVAADAAERIRLAYPGISIIGALDGYKSQDALVGHVKALNPQVVVCGMGAPRQEAFLSALASAGWSGIGFTCGGYFDHLGGRFHFYPAIFDRFNLRWLYRLAREPRRIGYRCVVEYGPFWRAFVGELLGAGRQKIKVKQ